VHQVLRVEGWTSRRIGSIDFYRCPACGDCQDLLFENSDGTVQCFACNKSSPRVSFELVKKRTPIGQCRHCGEEVPFTPSTTGIVGPLCPNFGCSNYVAVMHGKRFIQPNQVLDVRWNLGLLRRAKRVGPSLLLALCGSEKDYLVLRVLQVLAKQDDVRFKFANPEEHRAALFLDKARKRYLGFIIWTEGKGGAVLRQLFTVKEARRKGHAANVVEFWVENHANRFKGKFGIEEPNPSALRLHAKLGHLTIEGPDAIGLKCYFVRSM
jgi:hypothetical protein